MFSAQLIEYLDEIYAETEEPTPTPAQDDGHCDGQSGLRVWDNDYEECWEIESSDYWDWDGNGGLWVFDYDIWEYSHYVAEDVYE